MRTADASLNGSTPLLLTARQAALLCGKSLRTWRAVAAYTGLRASELASLKPESFDLESDLPTVTVHAAYSKHRRTDVLPLHPSLVQLLRQWLSCKPPDYPVWPGNWAKDKEAGVMLKLDLKAAGIPYVDESGCYADFHALRQTFITNMVKSGVSPKAALSLARHSTVDLTMNVYTSLTVNDQASAIASLPPIQDLGVAQSEAVQLRATGTDGYKKVPTVVQGGAGSGAFRLASEASDTAPNCTEKGPSPEEIRRMGDARNPGENGASRTTPHQSASDCKAEREGFEPSVILRPHRFSRPAQSATLAPLRRVGRRAAWFNPAARRLPTF